MARARSYLLVGLSVSLLACQPGVPPVPTGAASVPAMAAEGRALIGGMASAGDFAIAAGPDPLGDDQQLIIAHATVTLAETTGALKAVGVTDGTGAFTLFRSTDAFEPVQGTFYVLDVFNRVTVGNEKRFYTLRTIVQRQGPGWQSITGAGVVINATTTALAKLVAEGHATPAEVLGKVGGPAADQITPFGAMSPAMLAAGVEAVRATLNANGDPLALNGAVWTGHYFVSSADDLANLARYSVVTDNLIVTLGGGETIHLPNLTRVDGEIVLMGGGNLAAFEAPNLVRAGSIALHEMTITRVKAGRLRRVGGLGAIDSTLGSLELPSLTTIDNTLGFNGATITTGLHLPALVTISGQLVISNMTGLSDLAGFPALTTAGTLHIADNPDLHTISGFPRLNSVSGNFWVQDNPQLATVTGFPPAGPDQLRVGGDITLDGNAAGFDAAALGDRITTGP